MAGGGVPGHAERFPALGPAREGSVPGCGAAAPLVLGARRAHHRTGPSKPNGGGGGIAMGGPVVWGGGGGGGKRRAVDIAARHIAQGWFLHSIVILLDTSETSARESGQVCKGIRTRRAQWPVGMSQSQKVSGHVNELPCEAQRRRKRLVWTVLIRGGISSKTRLAQGWRSWPIQQHGRSKRPSACAHAATPRACANKKCLQFGAARGMPLHGACRGVKVLWPLRAIPALSLPTPVRPVPHVPAQLKDRLIGSVHLVRATLWTRKPLAN